jgi:hypothetical protein
MHGTHNAKLEYEPCENVVIMKLQSTVPG